MISIKPIAPEVLPLLAEEAGLRSQDGLRGLIASDGEHSAGTVFYKSCEPVKILALTAADSGIADGLCRTALYPLYEGGAREFELCCRPAVPLPPCYPVSGRGKLAALFGKNC